MANVFKVTLKLLLLPFAGLTFAFIRIIFFFGVIFNRKRISIFTFSESYSMPFLHSFSSFYGFENALPILISSQKSKNIHPCESFCLSLNFKELSSKIFNSKVPTRKASLSLPLFSSSMSRSAMSNKWKRAVKTF